ncbi:Myb/SANT-like domain containing protein [Parasponia andersonii]|uniref:Myb/SANT-like domain containing protein n=1 Tax=Parasponia andersonii TaxID=3476 RepID=A0A2P5BEW5_PARAD|nr:Myb/SANT-like domain containing protein [Parasponia andersonii]
MDSSKARGPGQNKRFWTEEEDAKLIKSLLELHNEGTFKAEGNFKLGQLKELEKALATKLPQCDLQAKPHIESRMRTLKTHFQVICEMLTGPNCSKFGLDPDKKMVTAEKPIWDEYLQSHKDASPFKNKMFMMIYAQFLEKIVQQERMQKLLSMW